MERSGLRPSLVRGESPRNAPLKIRAAAIRHHRCQMAAANQSYQLQTYRKSVNDGMDEGLVNHGKGWPK